MHRSSPERHTRLGISVPEHEMGSWSGRWIVPICALLILVVMTSGCIENDRENIEEQYSKVNGKVLEVTVNGNITTMRFKVMKLFGDYDNEAPNETYSLDSGDRITLVITEERRREHDFPDIEKGDYLKVSFYRNKGEKDYTVKYMTEIPHPYREFYLSVVLVGLCVIMASVFWKKWSHYNNSLQGVMREIEIANESLRDEFTWRSQWERNRYIIFLVLFLFFSPYLAILTYQFYFEALVGRWGLPYCNIFAIQFVLFLMAVVFLSIVFRFMVRENILGTGMEKGWMFETFLGILVIFQVVVQMFLYSLLISTYTGFFSGLALEGYPSRDLEFYEVFLRFLPGWLMVFTLGLFLVLHGSYHYHRQRCRDPGTMFESD